MRVVFSVYPEIDGEECEFEATAKVTFGTPAWRTGPPEHCHPGDPTEVEWVSFVGEGLEFKSQDDFEAWLSELEATFNFARAEEQSIEIASEDDDCDDDYGDYLYDLQKDAGV